ncbi:glycosyltransferase family 2 protein [Vibrio hippocampi]|uniref:Glycosyltransferase 2-like domain-containing protein n=1 Tax=Vibrio hippocampi TaxID=654686 RepID=A0ABM8ZL68_9VIBR|nr:glycosyltransferase family 2 protein [Vibrio hippocampi]CAH0529078.1 hypothetical protein VHP8226_03039 [Vibrio hippocampi]
MISVDTTILSWDRSDDTLAAISSALTQKDIINKVIVVDQGSKPENVTKLRDFSRDKHNLAIVYNDENLGVPGGRNCAARQGDGKYVVALDNDAEFINESQLKKAVDIMEENPDIAVLAFRILRFGSSEDDWSSWPFGSTDKWPSDSSFYTTKFVGAGHMIRREAFDDIGGYDDKLFFMHEEVDLSKRLINKGYKIRYTHEVVIGHKVSKEHRVPWNSTRAMYDVRNSLYLAVKLDTNKGAINTLLLLSHQLKRDFKLGAFKSSLKGLFLGLALFPRAIKLKNNQPENKTTLKAEEYNKMYSCTVSRTFFQRVARKVGQTFS